MKLFLLFAIILFFVACSNNANTRALLENTDSAITQRDSCFCDTLLQQLNTKSRSNYKQTKMDIEKIKSAMHEQYIKYDDSTSRYHFLDSVSNVFSALLSNEIIPFWYGMKWDFNGYSAIPNKGKIACGYFVSNTLKDMGIQLNRFRLAQQNPKNQAKSIVIDTLNLIRIIKQTDTNYDIIYKNLSKGFYFVGLDCHVGYFYYCHEKPFFIHSDYIGGKVIIERADTSEAFISNQYWFSKISGNVALMKSWIENKELFVVTF